MVAPHARFALGRGRPPLRIQITPKDRAELERLVRAETTSRRVLRRASILLSCERLGSAEAVARHEGVGVSTVRRVRGRYLREGLQALEDRPRPGHPPQIAPVARLQIISLACEPVPCENGVSRRTLDDLREEAIQKGVVAGIGRSTVHRILEQADLKPHKVRGWVHSQDPFFQEKVTEICDLYLHPPEGAVVLSIDEKTGMQAIERLHPDRPPRPGEHLRREFEYIRHGTQSLIAALNVHTGKVFQRCGDRRTARVLVRVMHNVALANPGVEIHVIWDNLNIHKGPRWERFNREHGGRFRFHYTPLHASWVNQVELYFSILQRKCLRDGSFVSRRDLRETVLTFGSHWNEVLGKPFRWTFSGYPLQTGIELKEAA